MSASEHTAHGRGSDREAELVTAVHELSKQIETLKADVRRLRGTGLPVTEPGWKDEEAPPADEASYAWIDSVGAPVRKRRGVPRVALYVIFLAAAATSAAVARLDSVVILGVMAGAWALVALIEMAATRAERQLDARVFSVPVVRSQPTPADPAWFQSPVERTLLEPPPDSPTAITRLPRLDLDNTVDRPPPD